MKFLKHILFIFSFCAFTQLWAQDLPQRPSPPKLVNDKLKLLTADQLEVLENKLVAFDKKTSTQIAIVTTDDMAGMEAGDYAVELGRKWGVGNKNFDNGVVFLVYRSPDNTKRKVFIASGYGLEGVLPDYTCSEIVNNEVIPYLKGGDFYHALDNGVNAIIKATEGRYTAPKGYGVKKPSLFKILLIIFLVILFLSIISKGGGGSYMSRRGHRGYTGPTIWWTGGGGGSGWGGGGGGSSGGGFGGFGGGSFGGGGAGGDW